MSKFNQKGFTLIEGLLVVLVLTVIVGVGYYVFSSMNKDDSSSNSAKTTAAPPVSSNDSSEAKYLTLKEFSVKIPLTDKIKDAMYEMAPDGETLGISTKKFEAAVGDCKAADTASSSFPTIVTVNKSVGIFSKDSPSSQAFLSSYVQLSGFYLTYGAVDTSYCNGADQDKIKIADNLYNQDAQELKNAIKSAKQL
jgi:prepilin-type N-terminal cleavage/methylation domain-containing protein